MEEVGKILPGVFKRHLRPSDPAYVDVLASLWPRLVGKAIAAQSWPVAFEKGTLQVATTCPTWAAQLRLLAEEMRAEINNHLGGPLVKKLRIGYQPKAEQTRSSARRAARPAFELLPAEGQVGAARLEPELSGVLQRSYSKYFSRPDRRVH